MIIDDTRKKKRIVEKSRKEVDKSKIILLLVLSVFSIFIILFYQVYRGSRENFNYIKEDKKEYLIYTRYNQNNKEVPYINVASESVSAANNSILDYCNNFINNDEANVSYQYNLNGNYLSLVIRVIDNSSGIPKIFFKTYNVDLKKKAIMSAVDLLNYFNVNEDIVYARVYNKFLDMYNEEVEQGFLEKDLCDFDCYVKLRGVDNISDNLSYYIKNGKLIAFKPFTYVSIYREESYFTEESFEFTISA